MNRRLKLLGITVSAVLALLVSMLGAPSIVKADDGQTITVAVEVEEVSGVAEFPLVTINGEEWISLKGNLEMVDGQTRYFDGGLWYSNDVCGWGVWKNTSPNTGFIGRGAEEPVHRHPGESWMLKQTVVGQAETVMFGIYELDYFATLALPAFGDCDRPVSEGYEVIDPVHPGIVLGTWVVGPGNWQGTFRSAYPEGMAIADFDEYGFPYMVGMEVGESRTITVPGHETFLLHLAPYGFVGSSNFEDTPLKVPDGPWSPTPTVTATSTPTVTSSPTGQPTVTPTATQSPTGQPTVTPTATQSPTVKPTATSSSTVKPTVQPTSSEFVRTAPYTLPGYHTVNGRQWHTTCESYSQTERCRTEIWATQVVQKNGKFVQQNGWVFNNLTYLPSPRALWANNPLGHIGQWEAADGREWITDCDSPVTGRNGCRSYAIARVIERVPGPGVNYRTVNKWVFNNIVMFG